MRILLTGATGFIGRRLTARLSQQGHEIVCLVRPGAPCPPGAISVPVDLGQPHMIEALPSGDALIHLAQSSRYREFPDAASDIFSVNTGATARLLDLARRNGTRSFLLASTGSVYSTRNEPCQEDAALQPADFYAASKVAAEALLRPYAQQFHTCALRLFTPYGAGQRNRLIPGLIERVRNRRPVSLDGEGRGLRLSVGYLDDVVATFQTAAEQGWDGTYNVAAPEPTCIAEIADAIGRELGIAPSFERTGRPEPPALVADTGRLARMCDVAAFRPLEDGIKAMLTGATRDE